MITSFKTEQLGIGFDFDIELEKDKQIYCFIGKNGIGKTQLLENMAKSLIFSHSMFKNSDNTHLYKYLKLFFNKDIYEKLKNFNLKLPLDIYINNTLIKNSKGIFNSAWNNTTFEFITGWQHSSFIFDKPIVFVGAKNRGFTKNIDTNNIKILSDRENRFVDSFQRTLKYINGEGLEQEEIADWFASKYMKQSRYLN